MGLGKVEMVGMAGGGAASSVSNKRRAVTARTTVFCILISLDLIILFF